jgi:hypothetical protein
MVLEDPATVALAILTSGAWEGDGDAAAEGEFVVPPQATAASSKPASNAPRTLDRAVMVILPRS